MQIDVVGARGQPVAAVPRVHRVRPERPAQPSHQCLQRAGCVGGRIAVPHLVHQNGRGHGPSGPQREHGQKGAQPRPAEHDGRAVGAECLGGAEDAVAHGVILACPVVPEDLPLRNTRTQGANFHNSQHLRYK